jgi:hypothetical protein
VRPQLIAKNIAQRLSALQEQDGLHEETANAKTAIKWPILLNCFKRFEVDLCDNPKASAQPKLRLVQTNRYGRGATKFSPVIAGDRHNSAAEWIGR